MNKKIIAVYYNGYDLDSSDFRSYKRIQDVVYVLYEESRKSLWRFLRPVVKRKFECYLASQDFQLGYQFRTDTYRCLIKPWLAGVDLPYLEDCLKHYRNKIDPNNPFIYKQYGPTIPISTTK